MLSTSYDKLREIEMFHKKKKRYKKIMRKRRRRTFTIIAVSLIIISFFIYAKVSQQRYSAFLMNNSKYGKVNNNILAKNIEEMNNNLNIQEVSYDWDGKIIKSNKPEKIIVHHAATTEMDLEKIHSLHIEEGYSGIGYHYYIKKDGIIYKGRDEEMQGAHAINENNKSIGICLEGNYEEEMPSENQIDSLINLSSSLIVKYNMKDIIRHGDCNNTLCPGKNINMDEIRNGIINVITTKVE